MKKQVKKIAFVGIVVVLLLLAWFILEKIIPDAEEAGTIRILDLDPKDYSMINVVEPGEEYRYYIGKIEPGEDAEEGAEPTYFFYDNGIYDDQTKYGYYEPYNMAKAFARTTGLNAIELVDENPTDYAQYGLDPESATIVIGLPYDDVEDAESFTLLIGDHNKIVTGEGYYCRLFSDETPEVYLISTLDAGTFLSGPEFYQSTEILPNLGEYYDEVRSLTLTNRAGQVMEFERFTKFDSEEVGELIYTNFYMTAPYSCYVSDNIIGDQMLVEIANTQVAQVVAVGPTEEELVQYGMDKAAKIHFNLAGGEYTYLFGTPNGPRAGVYYMMIEGYDTIYMGYGEAGFVDLTPIEFRSGLAWIHDIKLAGQLDIHTPDGDYTVIIDDTYDSGKGTGTWIAQIIDHTTGTQAILSESNGRALYNNCISTRYDELIVSEEFPIIEDEPSYSMTLKYQDYDYTSTVNFYKVTSRQYAVLFDDASIDTAGFTVNVVKLKEISDNLKTIMAGGVIEK
ncbi:MAG: DUF4340 domain-containing protein [Clostridia bacterium]|nr:DUF4340 domain-containing protein [Clostridia bacterium]